MAYFPQMVDPYNPYNNAPNMPMRMGGVCSCSYSSRSSSPEDRMGGGAMGGYYIPVQQNDFIPLSGGSADEGFYGGAGYYGGASRKQKTAAKRNIKHAHAMERKYGPTAAQRKAAKKNIKHAHAAVRRRDGGSVASEKEVATKETKVVKTGGQTRSQMLRNLAKARKMKAIRARAKKTPGGKGPIKNCPAARKLKLKETTKRV